MAYSWGDKSEPDVRYVIIGNGFDIECGMPTSYGDFLKFVSNEEWRNLPAGVTPVSPVDWEKLRDHNFWLKRFESVQIGDRWIDFESEIARVISTVERSMVNPGGTRAFADDDLRWDLMHDGLPILGQICDFLTDDGASTQTYRDLVKRLLDDLRELTRAFESYLYDYVCKREFRETKVTKGLVESLGTSGKLYVISFNYTQTLQLILRDRGIDPEFCYVHGIAGDGSRKNNMVLGINEPRESGEDKAPVEYGPFRKYNQRIYKQTDSRYMDWLGEARSPHERIHQLKQVRDQIVLSPNERIDLEKTDRRITIMIEEQERKLRKREVVIFGHSLGVTDKDILEPFITLPDTRTVVYHHSEGSFSDQVSNITDILGMDEVIARTGGKNRTLVFRDQSELA